MASADELETRVEELEDELHDLKVDYRDLEKENTKLQDEINSYYKEHETNDEAREQAEQKAVEMGDYAAGVIATAKADTEKVSRELEDLKVKTIKALSIAETVAMNTAKDNMAFFNSSSGKELTAWAVKELKDMAHNIFKEKV